MSADPELRARAAAFLESLSEPDGTLEEVIEQAEREQWERLNGAGDEPLGKNGGHAAEGHEPHPSKCPPSPLAIPFVGGCWECGRSWEAPGWVDAWIPDWAWTRISPMGRSGDGSGHLCVHCITAALAKAGLTEVPVVIAAPPYWMPGAP